MLIASNQSLAEFNLTIEPEIISGKERLSEMYDDTGTLYKSITEKVNTLSKFHYLMFSLIINIYRQTYSYNWVFVIIFYFSNI